MIVDWNTGATKTYGYSREHALGADPFKLLQTSVDRVTVQETLRRDGRWKGEFTQTTRTGQKIEIESHMVLVREAANGRELVMETNHAVTERREGERLLQRRTEELAEADREKNNFPADALFPGMPSSALENVEVDHRLQRKKLPPSSMPWRAQSTQTAQD